MVPFQSNAHLFMFIQQLTHISLIVGHRFLYLTLSCLTTNCILCWWQVLSVQVDWWLWSIGLPSAVEKVPPYHRTQTIYYWTCHEQFPLTRLQEGLQPRQLSWFLFVLSVCVDLGLSQVAQTVTDYFESIDQCQFCPSLAWYWVALFVLLVVSLVACWTNLSIQQRCWSMLFEICRSAEWSIVHSIWSYEDASMPALGKDVMNLVTCEI